MKTPIRITFSPFVLILLFQLFSLHGKSQTYNCNQVATSNFGSDMKTTKSVVNIETGKAQISISKFLNGGTEPLVITIDSVRSKEYNYELCKWYYGRSDDRKDIVIVPSNKKSLYLFEFADEVTVFQYTFYHN